MELSTEQRQAISDHCLPSSWQMLSAWRLRNLSSLNDGPELLAAWLADAPMRSQVQAHQMVRSLSQRLWAVQLLSDDQSAAPAAGVRKLAVVCGGQRWILWLQPQPQLRLLRIEP